MQKAGGIIGLIAGIFGVFAAGITLFVGGIGKAVEADQASMIVGLGWGGLLFSFLCIVFGAVVMNAESKIHGVLLILCAIIGAVTGGTLVAIFMLLALVGGVLATIGTKKTPIVSTNQ
ncbi:MAG: hypothetical protein EPO23_06495 [Xanthobacteraceae bacterium]|nr:MAG: hypothetical protein EPO23_06495 [Xanthobacteraceae bacterium]